MKKIILTLLVAFAAILNARAQSKVIIRQGTPVRRVVVVRHRVITPARAVVVVRPARPVIVHRRVIVSH